MLNTEDSKNTIEKPRESGLFYFDKELAKKENVKYLIGVDEAGRGPLAGPVVACAAFLPLNAAEKLNDLNDSKKLSHKKRKDIFSRMINLGVRFSFAYSSAQEIDSLNILNATMKAMKQACERLNQRLNLPLNETLYIIDGPYKVRGLNFKQSAIIDGDAKSLSIAAASVFAKNIRDRWMDIIDLAHPQYGFSKHKGYGTKLHTDNISAHGITPWHRKSFAPVKKVICAQ